VIGEWKISNGYKTIEFFPTDPCGQNSCGETMYCLPAGDDLLGYDVLLRTAHANLGSVVPWDSIYGTGVADLAGNLLDGDKDGVEQASERERNIPAEPRNEITPAQKQPDNYYWNFFVADRVDREPPSIKEISPEIDGENVEAGDLRITFNTEILSRSTRDIDLLVQDGVFEDEEGYNPGESARLLPVEEDDNTTAVRIRPASDLKKPDLGVDQSIYYFLATPHTVQNNNQQCFYPGLGPKLSGETTTVCTPLFNEEGLLVNSDNCGVAQGYNANTDTGCPYESADPHVTANTETCLVKFEEDINRRNVPQQ